MEEGMSGNGDLAQKMHAFTPTTPRRLLRRVNHHLFRERSVLSSRSFLPKSPSMLEDFDAWQQLSIRLRMTSGRALIRK
jgi:hypothetical protein